jgi:hypothetical protein
MKKEATRTWEEHQAPKAALHIAEMMMAEVRFAAASLPERYSPAKSCTRGSRRNRTATSLQTSLFCFPSSPISSWHTPSAAQCRSLCRNHNLVRQSRDRRLPQRLPA